MFAHWPLLSLLIWIPVFGAIPVILTGDDSNANWARHIAMLVSLVSLALSIILWANFNTHTSAMQFTVNIPWITQYHINYALGVDGISLPLVVLTCFTTFLVVATSWTLVHKKVAQYLAAFLIMQGMIIGVFEAMDSMLFYFFWEGMLIPMYISIGIWGGGNRSYAAVKFFIYTFLGSAILLVALIYLSMQSGSFAIDSFYPLHMSMATQILIFVSFLLAFGIKVPMWPLHTWLPDAHTEAPAGGSVILAALMLKLGVYGFLRFTLPIVPDASRELMWLMIGLSMVAIVWVGVVALAQRDMKRLIAYSSVAHMGFATLGCFLVFLIVQVTGNTATAALSLEGAMIQMITHAFGSGALFLAFGILYQQIQTRDIRHMGGIAKTMPLFAAFFMVFAMSNAGLPGTSGFVGEFMIILSAFKTNLWVALAAASTLVIGAAYTLWMYKRAFYGPVTKPEVEKLHDIHGMNYFVFFILAALVIVIGFYPSLILNTFHASVSHLLHLTEVSKLA